MAKPAVSVRNTPRFVYKIAHKIRVALATESVRRKVSSIVFDTLKPQSEMLLSDSKANIEARRKHIEWSMKGSVGKEPPLSGDNRGRAVKATDWPFPIEYGIEDAPGCIIALAAINDFFAKNPSLSRKTDCAFVPLEPFGNGGETCRGAWFLYGTKWIDAVKNLTAEHEDDFRAVVEHALSKLGFKDGSLTEGEDDRKPNSKQSAVGKLKSRLFAALVEGDAAAKRLTGFVGDSPPLSRLRNRRRTNSARVGDERLQGERIR